MEIKEKNNITVYVTNFDEKYFYLNNISGSPLDEDFHFIDENIYILPKEKACLAEFPCQFTEITAYIEYIEKEAGGRHQVYLSQTNWLYIKNLIKDELGLDVKIKKRYPGKLTVAELRTPGKGIDKLALRKLSEEIAEKIHIKPANSSAKLG